MRVLFIPNWNVARLSTDDTDIQAPDKVVEGQPYWFFRHFDEVPIVDVLDRGQNGWVQKAEEKAKFYVRQPLEAWRRRNGYDLVISHGAQSGLVYELACSYTKQRPPHLMIDVGCLNGGRINRTETPLIRYALRRGPHIITHNTSQLSFYKEHYPALAERASFIPFGVDLDYFQAQPPVSSRRIVSFGHRKRDNLTLCQAFPKGMGWKLIVIGDTSLAPQYACDEIEFHEALPLSQLMSQITQSEAVAIALPELPYSYGQMSLLQSMAMARPVICTLTTSTTDYVANAPCVDTVPPADVAAMRKALCEMMTRSNEERAARGTACRQWVEEHFGEEMMAHRIECLIHEIMQS